MQYHAIHQIQYNTMQYNKIQYYEIHIFPKSPGFGAFLLLCLLPLANSSHGAQIWLDAFLVARRHLQVYNLIWTNWKNFDLKSKALKGLHKMELI